MSGAVEQSSWCETGRWFRRHHQQSSRIRLFCFPCAGECASMYRDWHDWLAPEIDVVAVELPGRGIQIGEAPMDDMNTLVAALSSALRPLIDQPFAFFGHGLGALVAFELSRRLAAAGGRQPEHLMVSGIGAPHLDYAVTPIHTLPDKEFLATLRALNQSAALGDCVVEVLRADCRLLETYRCGNITRLGHPITAFGGIDDESCDREDLEAWQEHTAGRCVVRWLLGDHSFIIEHQQLIVSTLAAMSAVRRNREFDPPTLLPV